MTAGPPADRLAVICVPIDAAYLEPLAASGVTVVHWPGCLDGASAEALGTAHGLLVSPAFTVDADVMARAPQLEVISTVSVGLDHIDLETARRRNITVTTTPVLADAVADLTLMLLLAVARRLPEARRNVTTGAWSAPLLGVDLRDKTLLLVGYGRIGQEVARRAAACKMHVVYFDTRVPPAETAGAAVATLAEGLAMADVVSLHVDLNPSTAHLINRETLALMKPSAILVNTSRGGVVDQAALTSALVEGRLAGAGLDVLEAEPPHDDDPLLRMDNVVVVPHLGSATVETRRAMFRTAVDSLRRCLLGLPCRYVLDPPGVAEGAR